MCTQARTCALALACYSLKNIPILHFFVLYLFLFFNTGFFCIALAVLELIFVDQAGLELRNPPASASQVLGLKVCATTAQVKRFSLAREAVIRANSSRDGSKSFLPNASGSGLIMRIYKEL